MMDSCEPGRVRTYQCKEDGTRTIKYFKYVYDFDENKCVEKIHKKTEPCVDDDVPRKHRHHLDDIDEEEEEYDDYEDVMPHSRRHRMSQKEDKEEKDEEPKETKKGGAKKKTHKKKTQSIV